MKRVRAGQVTDAVLVSALLIGFMLLAMGGGLWYFLARQSAQLVAMERSATLIARRQAAEAQDKAQRSETIADSVVEPAIESPPHRSSASSADSLLARLPWLAGSWYTSTRDNEEHWLPPQGGLMLGMNRSVSASGQASFEFMRIAETPEGLVFYASPGGRAATPFELAEQSDGRVVFENTGHDFPQRVIYERVDQDTLRARVEGRIDGESRQLQWQWVRGTLAAH